MRRVIVNVATGRYLPCQQRLVRELEVHAANCSVRLWQREPNGCPPQAEKPYAFKAYALREAALTGGDLLLWCDAAVVPIRSLEPLWERIEREGYWLALNGWTNYEWTADSAYADLFPERTIEEAREINKTFPQMVGTAFGLNVRHPLGSAFLAEYFRLARTNAFVGPWANSNCAQRMSYGEGSCYTTAPCGPPDVLGHRHDQTAASVLAWRLQMQLTQCPEVFSYPPASENTILLAKGC